MASDLTALKTEVTNTEGADASAVVLIVGFAAYVEAHKNDPVALQGYVDRLRATSTALGAAVAANPLPA